MPTQDFRRPPRASDLFGFKAIFCSSALPSDLMPLLAFPGGYGGMVHTDGGRVSLSCCIRRDQLERCRKQWPHVRAGEAVLTHIKSSCKASRWRCRRQGRTAHGCLPGHCAREFARSAAMASSRSAMRPPKRIPSSPKASASPFNRRRCCAGRLVAHPELRSDRRPSTRLLEQVRHDYAPAWRRNFSPRLYVAAALAHLFMRPISTRIATTLLERFPQLLTEGARWSGKTTPLRGAGPFDMARS